MNVALAIRERRSIRSYEKKAVERKKIEKVLEAARLAPSGRNEQPWRFVLIRNKETIARMALACPDHEFIAEADAVICCCVTSFDHMLKNGVQGYTLDLAAAVSFMMLQATELGLGTCWVGAFNETKVKKLLRIPEEVKVVSILTVGYPHYVPPPKGRKELSKIVAVENYHEPYQ